MEQLNLERRFGVLNEKNREFILSEWDSSGDKSRQRRYRIRQQLAGAFRDLYYFTLLPKNDRELVLEAVFAEGNQDKDDLLDNPSDSGRTLLTALFRDLYSDLNSMEFQFAVEQGVEEAIVNERMERDRVYPDVEPRLTIEQGDFGDFDADKILSWYRDSPDDMLPWGVEFEHIERLYQAGEVSYDEYSRFKENAYRTMSDEESRHYNLYLEERELEAAKTWNRYEEGWSVNDVNLLKQRDYLTKEEADAILNGGSDRLGFRPAAHYLTCAVDEDDAPDTPIGPPESPADVPIKDWEELEDLQQWHQRTKGNWERYRAEMAQKDIDVEDDDHLGPSHCVNVEIQEHSLTVNGEDLGHGPLRYHVPEPEHDPEALPSREHLTPTYIEELRDRGIIGEDRRQELLSDVLEDAPHLLGDDQIRALFAAGEIGLDKVWSVLDPTEMTEEYIENLHDEGRIAEKQYLDMLEMKCRRHAGSLRRETLERLIFEEDRVDPFELHPDNHIYLLKAEIYTPSDFLDALEAAWERSPEQLGSDDVIELYDAGRVTAEEVVDHPNTHHTDEEHLIEGDAVTELYPEDYGIGV